MAGAEAAATVAGDGGQTAVLSEPVTRPAATMTLEREPAADTALEPQPVLVSDVAPESGSEAVDQQSAEGAASGPVEEESVEAAASPDSAERQSGAAADVVHVEPAPEPAAEQAEPPESVRERRLLEISALLQDAAACEDTDAGRAASLLQQAVVGCLDGFDDPLGDLAARRDLLESFDRLSALLERGGLPEEALDVVDDAASLGLLEDADAGRSHCEALRERREDLRRVLFVDSAQL